MILRYSKRNNWRQKPINGQTISHLHIMCNARGLALGRAGFRRCFLVNYFRFCSNWVAWYVCECAAAQMHSYRTRAYRALANATQVKWKFCSWEKCTDKNNNEKIEKKWRLRESPFVSTHIVFYVILCVCAVHCTERSQSYHIAIVTVAVAIKHIRC